MKLQQCDDCGKFRRHVTRDKYGKACTPCISTDYFDDYRTGHQFTYKFLLMDLENEVKNDN